MDGALIVGATTVVIGGSIVGFFVTKNKGFGRFTAAVLILMLVLYVACVAFAMGHMEMVPLVNLLFAMAGYAGGLLSLGKENSSNNKDQTQSDPL